MTRPLAHPMVPLPPDRQQLVRAVIEATVSNEPWSKFTQADYTPEQWSKACLVHVSGDGKAAHKLPVRTPSGALNRNGVHAAASRIGQVDAPADVKKTAARALVRAYGQLKEEPPESLRKLAETAISALTPTPVNLTEAGTVKRTAKRRRYRARLIEGDRWGSSGYYSRQVLERDGPAAFPAGTLMYLDHPTAQEAIDRPERSFRDVAGKIASTPRYENDGLYAEVQVFPHMVETVDALAEDTGLSIRASGTAENGEIAGRYGPIVSSLISGHSVDFVTQAGAGGRLVQLLEAERQSFDVALREAGSIGAWVESRLHLAFTEICDCMYGDGRLTREERITMSSAVGDALEAFASSLEDSAPQLYARDRWGDQATTPSLVPTPMPTAMTENAHVSDGTPPTALPLHGEEGSAAMTAPNTGPAPGGSAGTITHAPAVVPVQETTTTGTAPAAPTTPVYETIDNANAAARVALAEAQRDEAVARAAALAEAQTAAARVTAERDAAIAESRRLRADGAGRDACLRALNESNVPENVRAALAPRVVDRVLGRVPLTESGEVNVDALRTLIDGAIESERTYAAALLEAQGVGVPRGLGSSQRDATTLSSKELEDGLEKVFSNIGMNESAAKRAARGR